MSEQNYKEVWNEAIKQIHDEYKKNGQESEFKLWFNMEYIEDDINSITVSVASDFLWQSMVKKGNIKRINEKIEQLIGSNTIEIKPLIRNSLISSADSGSSLQEPASPSHSDAANQKSTEPKYEFQHYELKSAERPAAGYKNNTLNEKYTFDSFISGEGNSFAYNVAVSASENPGERNPILFYGGVGLGKTHLMQAIGNAIANKYGSGKKICYIQAESFTNDFTNSLVTKTQSKFKSKYRNLDVLLLDDIHFLQGKEGTQDELFYTFEALHKNKAQMVFTCDRPIREIQNMADRLISRLGSGMCLDLQPPNYETRRAILYKKLEIEKKSLPSEIIDYISRTVETNIRDLESALNKILGYSEFIDSKLTIETAQYLLKDIYSAPTAGNVSIGNIQKVVADNYQITVQELKGKKRDKKYVVPRHIALYITRELTEYTFTDIGNEFGGRDHSSIMHAYDNISKKIETDPSLRSKINLMIKEIKECKK